MTAQAIDDTLLMAYVDGELHPVTAGLVAEQIATDPATRERAALFRASAALLRAALAEPEAEAVPEALRARVTHMIAHAIPPTIPPREHAPPRRLWRGAWVTLAVAASVAALMVGIAGSSNGGAEGDRVVARVLDEVGDYHTVYAREREHLVEVPASRRAHLEAWLGARVGLAFQAPDLGARGLEFQGGRLLAIDKRPVAQLMYTGQDGAPVALCITQTDSAADSPIQTHEEDGLRLFGRRQGRHVFIVVGPASNGALRAIAEAMPGLMTRS